MNEMTVNAPASLSGTMDVDEFMAFMETRPKGEHWDLINGVAVMMAPASYAHRQIALNFCILLRSAFAAQGLDLRAIVNVGVRSPGARYFQPEPDVAVVPGIAGYDLYYAVVVEPRKFWVEIYAKSRKWEPLILECPDDVVEMPEFGLRCQVADLYIDTPLDPRRAG